MWKNSPSKGERNTFNVMYRTVCSPAVKLLEIRSFPIILTGRSIFLSVQAIANESGINFISVKGPELLNMVC